MQQYYLLLLVMNFKQLEQYFIVETADVYDSEESKQLFYMIVEHLTGWNRSLLLMRKEEEVTGDLQQKFVGILHEIQKGVPVQHIFSEAWFYGLKFKVNGSVLIPRPETEELVEWILNDLSASGKGHQSTADNVQTRILDIGTGSGCIAISLQKFGNQIDADAMDVSEEALIMARENAVINIATVNFIAADILKAVCDPAGIRTPRYNVIVSNPPYITDDERLEMHQNVLDYEPHLALFVTNDNPLIFYKAIADYALQNLEPGGYLYFEINEYLGKQMIEMLLSKGLTDIILKKDMQGKDRMIRCSLSA